PAPGRWHFSDIVPEQRPGLRGKEKGRRAVRDAPGFPYQSWPSEAVIDIAGAGRDEVRRIDAVEDDAVAAGDGDLGAAGGLREDGVDAARHPGRQVDQVALVAGAEIGDVIVAEGPAEAEAVDAGAAGQHVIALAALEPVGAGAADQRVV